MTDKRQIKNARERCAERAHNFAGLLELAPVIESAANVVCASLQGGGTIMFCGNGGSAADSQHLATELMGRFLLEREPMAAIALTVDTSSLTAISNDYGFERVFARQLAGIGKAGDVLVCLSTSGNSANVVLAAETAREMGIAVVSLTGKAGGKLAAHSDILLRAPAARTDLIQEIHIAVGHILCGLVEDRIFSESPG